MSKMNPNDKKTPTFLFAKLKGMNDREAGRFFRLIFEGVEARACSSEALEIYLACCKEPKIDKSALAKTIVKNGVEKNSRSKLVMEYEKHRKAWNSILKARNLWRPEVDAIVEKVDLQQVKSSENPRAFVLSKIGDSLGHKPQTTTTNA